MAIYAGWFDSACQRKDYPDILLIIVVICMVQCSFSESSVNISSFGDVLFRENIAGMGAFEQVL